jgi:hypothetical protein
MRNSIPKLALFFSILGPIEAWAACSICLYTPAPVTTISRGRGQATEVLKEPMFGGELFYSVDGREKKPLVPGKGIYLTFWDTKAHTINILGLKSHSWSKINIECADYPNGAKIRYRNDPNYGSGWMTTPLPKDQTKCPFYEKSDSDS